MGDGVLHLGIRKISVDAVDGIPLKRKYPRVLCRISLRLLGNKVRRNSVKERVKCSSREEDKELDLT